jgi:hypothetical protein
VLIYLSLHIDEFFPKETSILTSLKQWLERNAINRGIDDFRKQQRRDLQPGSIDRDIIVSESGDRVKTEPKDDRPHGLEAIFAGLNGKCAEKMKEYVEKDPEGKLKACAMRHPHENCNCYTLVQMRFFSQPPLSETGAAEAIGVNKNSLHYHWNRRCLPLLKEIVREIAANLGHEFG